VLDSYCNVTNKSKLTGRL